MLIAFDFDRVLMDGETLDILAQTLIPEHSEEIAHITELGMSGNITFKESLEYRISFFGGVDLKDLEKVFLPAMPGLRCIRSLAKYNEVGVISGGFEEIIRPYLAKHGIYPDFIEANSFIIEEGAISGAHIRVEDKGEIFQKYKKGITAALGDGMTDWPMISQADYGYAFNPNAALAALARQNSLPIIYGDLGKIQLPYLSSTASQLTTCHQLPM